ncbi:MAG: hypothetical protein WAT39_14120, partial [Planctomycetota bacterium]
MSNASKFVVPLLLLAAVGGGVAWFALQGGHDAPPAPVAPPTPVPIKPEPVRVEPAQAPVPQDPPRTAATSPATGQAHA